MDNGQAANADPAQQLLQLILALNERLQTVENRPQQPAPAAQAQQLPQQPAANNTPRAAAFDFGYTPEEVTTSWRELSDRVRAVPIPSSTAVNTTKPRGASTSTKMELDTIAKIAPIAKVLLQLQVLQQRGDTNAEQLAQASLIIGLHLTSILQQRQGDLFVETAFPEAFDTFRQLRAGPGGSIAGEELQRLTTAIQLSNQAPRRQNNNNNTSSRGNYNNHNNSNYGNYNNRGGHRGGYQQGFNTRGGFNHYNQYNQRGGYNSQDRGGDQ
jgi:hypothetical protein